VQIGSLQHVSRRLRAAGLAASVMVLVACGGGDDDDAAGVASLVADQPAAAASPDAANQETTSIFGAETATVSSSPTNDTGSVASDPASPAASTGEDALLAFAECMRSEGIDMPDLQFNESGGLLEALEGVDVQSEEFRAAEEVCRDLLQSAVQDLGGGDFDTTAIEDALLAFTDCLRGEGFDVGDIELGGGLASGEDSSTGTGGGQDGSAGQQQGAGGGLGAVLGGGGTEDIAEALGLDPNDEAVIAAIETCEPALLETLQDIQLGAPAGE
jgi:hypothetical protein